MTEAEKNEIVGLVMTEISSQAVDFDIATEQPQANDLLTAVRETESGGYRGVTIKWDDVARIATELANQAVKKAEQAKTDAVNAKNIAQEILTGVQNKGTEITNFVATSKTEIETQKNESVNAVKSVYQTDLNELKGDLADVKERVNPITGAEEVMQLTYISGYYKNTGEVVDVTWASRTERISLVGISTIIFDGSFINFPGGFTNFYKDGVGIYHVSESSLYAGTLPFSVDCSNYDEVEFSFNNTGLSDIIIRKVINSEFDDVKNEISNINTTLNEFAPKNIPSFSFPVGEKFEIYKENVVLADNEQGIVDYLANDMTEKTFVLTQTSAKNESYIYFIYNKDMTSSKTYEFNIDYKIANKTAKKVLLLGDSTIDTSPVTGIPPEAKALKDAYGENLTLIGTRGSGDYKHCGIGGWSAYDWWNQESFGENVNPFYNSSVKHFDFAYGITENSLDVPDIVIIQLGINDITAVTRPYGNYGLVVATDKFIESMNKIIADIKEYNSNIKVYVNLIIPPSKDWSHYMAYAGSYLSPNIAKQHDIYANARALEELKGMDGFLPINCIIDRDNDLADRVHPNGTGYEKIGQFLSKCLSVI